MNQPLFWIDPAELPLANEAAMIYATTSNFDGNTMPVYAAHSQSDSAPVEPEEVYSPHTEVISQSR